MSEKLFVFLTLLAALGSGLIAGVFFAFSSFVMAALGRLPSDQVGEVLRGSRYLAMPSLWNETGGLAALEAMALARPVLVSSLGGLPELIRGGTGLQCRPGDAVDLAKQIQRLMDDSDLCRAAGVRGLTVSRHEFGPEMHLARLETAFRSVLT